MKKALVLLLAVLMVLPLFAACTSGNSNAPETSANTGDPIESTPTVTDVPTTGGAPESSGEETTLPADTEPAGPSGVSSVPVKELNHDVRVLSHSGSWQSYDIIGYEDVNLVDRENANIANAIEIRNDRVSDSYKVTFTNVKDPNLVQSIRRSSARNTHEYDIVLPNIPEAGELSQLGLLIPIQDLPYCETDQPWYNQRALSDLAIMGNNFFFFSDITLVNLDAIWVYFFNNEVVEKYQLDSPYTALAAGEWTLDTMLEMCEIVTDKDVDNMTKDNHWGLAGHDFNVTAFYVGSGEKIASSNAAGDIKLTMNTTRITDVIEASLKFRPYWIRYPLYSSQYVSDFPGADERYGFVAGDNYPEIVASFTGEHTLFMGEVLDTLRELSNYDINSGVLPVPKLNSTQTEHYSTTTNNATATAVPTTTPDTELISIIIEAWAYESHKTLIPVYKENCMKGVYSQDLVTPEVLEEVFNSASYDMGIYYNWGELAARYRAMVYSGSSDFTSLYRGYGEVAETAIKDFVKKYS